MFVDLPLTWYHDAVRVDRQDIDAGLAAIATGLAVEAQEVHDLLGMRAGKDWHALRTAHFVLHPERIAGIVLHLADRGQRRISDGRHRYAAALYLGLDTIPDCWVIGSGAHRYFQAGTGAPGPGPERDRTHARPRRSDRTPAP